MDILVSERRRRRVRIGIAAALVVGTAWGVHSWTAGRYQRDATRVAKETEKYVLDQAGVITATEASETALMDHLTKALEDSAVLEEQLARASDALGDVESHVVELTTWQTEHQQIEPETITRWLPSLRCDPVVDTETGEIVYREIQPPVMYATGSHVRLKTDAGATFAVGEVKVWGEVPDDDDVMLFSAPWEYDLTELLIVAEPVTMKLRRFGYGGLVSNRSPTVYGEYRGEGRFNQSSDEKWTLAGLGTMRIGRVTFLAGLNTDPGISVGALWNGWKE